MNITWFLRGEVPVIGSAVEDLWVDREEDVAWARTCLWGALEHPCGQPMVIAGYARVGKSHLMHLLLRELDQQQTIFGTQNVPKVHLAHMVPSRPSNSPRLLLVNALRSTLAAMQKALHREAVAPDRLNDLQVWMERFRPLIDDPKATMELSQQEADQFRNKLSTGGKLGGSLSISVHAEGKAGGGAASTMLGLPEGKAGSGLSGTGTAELSHSSEKEDGKSTQQAQKIVRTAFDETGITNLIREIHRTVRAIRPDWRTVLAFDDFDLLYRKEDRSFDPQPMLHALADLAEEPGLFVLATIRSDTLEENNRLLYKLRDLNTFEDPETLVQIYERQLHYWAPGAGEVLPLGLVRDVAKRCDGRVGIFLEFLRDVFQENGKFLLSEDYMSKVWARIGREVPEKAAILRTGALTEFQQLQGVEAEAVRLGKVYRWVYEDYTSNDRVTIHPVLASLLKEGKLT